MGCVASRIDKDERVQICKERKRLMKQLVVFRGEFADAQLDYLRALKNTGVTLRQFTESESLELENTSYGLALPPSPPLPLPPSPPPPPPFSPDLNKSSDNQKEDVVQEESIKLYDNDGDDDYISSSVIQCSSWNNLWDNLEPHFPEHLEKSEMVKEPVAEEENWSETKTEFEDEVQEVVVGNVGSSSVSQKQQRQQSVRLVDDNSSMMSLDTKDAVDAAMVNWRSKKTLEGIVKDLDDYFLKASAGGKEIAVLIDISKGITLSQNCNENKRKRSNSAKVFSALSWTWSSKSLQLRKDAAEVCSPSEPCKPGAHCITLDKLCAAEQKLYKEVREEEMTKLELEKKSMLLIKQEEENQDWSKTDKTRSSVEDLETDIRRLQHSISTTCSLILEVIDVELYPQLLALTAGLKNMWRTIYECHQVQNHISQQLNYLTDDQSTEMTTDYRRHATQELDNEVTSWYISYCKLQQSQREYVKTLCRWIGLTACLVDDHRHSSFSSAVRRLCEEWQLVFDRLPDKIASGAINSFLTAIKLIMNQQAEECSLQKKSEKLDKRLQKELFLLSELEKKLYWSSAAGDAPSNLSPKHPLTLKRAKAEALKNRADAEKTKYLNSVQVTKVMTLSKLKTSLPHVFQALMAFASASAQGFESIHSRGKQVVDSETSENSNELKT